MRRGLPQTQGSQRTRMTGIIARTVTAPMRGCSWRESGVEHSAVARGEIDALAIARLRYANRACPWHSWTERHARYGSWPIIRTTLSPSGRAFKNRLRWHLHELFPGCEIPAKSLDRWHLLRSLARQLECFRGTLTDVCYVPRDRSPLKSSPGHIRRASTGVMAQPTAVLEPIISASWHLGAFAAPRHGYRRR